MFDTVWLYILILWLYKNTHLHQSDKIQWKCSYLLQIKKKTGQHNAFKVPIQENKYFYFLYF